MISSNIQKNHSNKARTKCESMKDQFYTTEAVIRKCIALATPFLEKATSCLDFSAGNDDFVKHMKLSCPSIASYYSYDIDPRSSSVIQQDFLQLDPFPVDVIGFNPPFGHKSATIKKFLVHAAKFTPRVFMLILPFHSEWIYPAQYKEVLHVKLEENSFYVPGQGKEFKIKNCKFVVLQHDATYVHPGIDKSEVVFDMMKRLPQSKVEEWWPEFKQGFAVRRTGVNSGKQVLYWKDGHGVFIDHHGKEFAIDSFVNGEKEKVSAVAFYAYQMDSVSLSFCQSLWKELLLIHEAINESIVPRLSVHELSRCIQRVLNK